MPERATTAVPATGDRPRLRPAGGGRRRGGRGEPVHAALAARELWLAVHLPHYVLEALHARTGTSRDTTSSAADEPVVVVDPGRNGQVICDGDARARAAGIVHGMALNSALALQPGLRVLPRDSRGEQTLLETIAAVANEFTPRVSLEPPDGVLLEVRGSLKLFGGVRPLCGRLRERLRSLGLDPRIAITPTPLASLWFARACEEVALRRPEALPARLAPLPLAGMRWPEQVLQALAAMGVRTVGDCLRLPRDGFARRFGPRLRLELDRALGRAPDPRAAFVWAERFAVRRDLEPELTDTGRLQGALEPLLAGLCAFLQRRGGGIESLEFRLQHRDAPETRLHLRFAEPVAALPRIAGLLKERLARTRLPAPVRAVRLRSGRLVEVPGSSQDLFALGRMRACAVPQLVERLRARLGDQAVYGLRIVPEHRPEAAQQNGEIGGILLRSQAASWRRRECLGGEECPRPARPVWLLAEPQPLGGQDGPSYEGRLEIEEGPERIESGWWDGRDVRRDYYVARNPGGVRLWIFRERRAEGGWFLHGVFG